MNVQTKIDNYQDVIDSRDVIARIEGLTSDRDTLREAIYDTEANTEDRICAENDLFDWDEAEELAALEALASEASDYASDWKYGETLIRDSYFTDYIMEMLEDCGDLPADIPWYVEIDKEATARNCQVDYTSVDYDGITYWIR